MLGRIEDEAVQLKPQRMAVLAERLGGCAPASDALRGDVDRLERLCMASSKSKLLPDGFRSGFGRLDVSHRDRGGSVGVAREVHDLRQRRAGGAKTGQGATSEAMGRECRGARAGLGERRAGGNEHLSRATLNDGV